MAVNRAGGLHGGCHPEGRSYMMSACQPILADESFAMETHRGMPVAHAALAAKACWIGLVLLASGAAAPALESFCPESAVKIVVPFPPGGPTDISARILSERLRERLGQNIIVEAR